MPKVLIPSDDDDVVGLAEAYRSMNWDVVIGAAEYANDKGRCDVVHHNWPEEYCGWTSAPTERKLAEIECRLRRWTGVAKNIFTVHNLYPHCDPRNPAWHKLYSIFYRDCHLVSHFSHASLRLARSEFPAAHASRHIVHCPPNHELALKTQLRRGSHRAEMGIGEDEFVVLVIGRVRSAQEMELIRRAFDAARIPKKRLLMAGKLAVSAGPWRGCWLSLKWKRWLRRRQAVVETRYVPENELARFLDSSDVVIIPRFAGHLNSGVLFLTMTFGRMLIAPDFGAYPEQLASSRNLLFEPGDPASLSTQLERSAALDREDIGRQNALIASQWGWRRICWACLDALDDETTASNALGSCVGIGG